MITFLLAFLAKEGVDFNLRPNFGIDSSDCENLWIDVMLHSMKCGVVYRHPTQTHEAFDEKLFAAVDFLNNSKYLFYLWLFNMNLLKYSQDSIVTEYVDMVHSFSCKALISKSTIITEQSFSLIDHIYSIIPH